MGPELFLGDEGSEFEGRRAGDNVLIRQGEGRFFDAQRSEGAFGAVIKLEGDGQRVVGFSVGSDIETGEGEVAGLEGDALGSVVVRVSVLDEGDRLQLLAGVVDDLVVAGLIGLALPLLLPPFRFLRRGS